MVTTTTITENERKNGKSRRAFSDPNIDKCFSDMYYSKRTEWLRRCGHFMENWKSGRINRRGSQIQQQQKQTVHDKLLHPVHVFNAHTHTNRHVPNDNIPLHRPPRHTRCDSAAEKVYCICNNGALMVEYLLLCEFLQQQKSKKRNIF